MIEFKHSTVEHCYELAPNMRETDAKEVLASNGLDPLSALIASIQNSRKPETIYANGKMVGMRGVGHAGTVGYPWLLGTPEMVSFAKSLHATAKPWVDNYLLEYPLLYNYVSEDNRAAILWLKRLGFVMIRYVPDYGIMKKPFYEFVRIK